MPKPPVPLPFRRNRPLQGMVIWLLAVWTVTAIEPFNHRDRLLENLLLSAYAALLAMAICWLSNRRPSAASLQGDRVG